MAGTSSGLGHFPLPLRAVVYEAGAGQFDWQQLAPFGISISPAVEAVSEPFVGHPANEFDVAVIDADWVGPNQLCKVVQVLQRQQIATVIVGDSELLGETLAILGADAIAPHSSSPDSLAAAIFSALHAAKERTTLERKISELRQEVDKAKLVGRAKSIVARQLNISESQALQNLRREARNRRRPLHELAQVIIEAHEITKPLASKGSEFAVNHESSATKPRKPHSPRGAGSMTPSSNGQQTNGKPTNGKAAQATPSDSEMSEPAESSDLS